MHLIIGKDKEEVKRALDSHVRECSLPRIVFNLENFSLPVFLTEVETPPFLSPKKTVIVHDYDLLMQQDRDGIDRYVEKPTPWIHLFLTASDVKLQNKLSKLIEAQGTVQRFSEEKPWEKEKRLSHWLVAEAQREGIQLRLAAATALVQLSDPQMLRKELDKLICFAYLRKEISVEDIAELCAPIHHETMWQLSDAVLGFAISRALKVGGILLEEGMSLFPLLASLRSQFITGIELLTLGATGAKKYPYLKGNLLEKKMQLFQKYGLLRLKRGVSLIFETELKAKNSAQDPAILLELLIIKLTHDALPPT